MFLNYYFFKKIQKREDLKFIPNRQFRDNYGFILMVIYLVAPLLIFMILIAIGTTPLINFFAKRKFNKINNDIDKYMDDVNQFQKT